MKNSPAGVFRAFDATELSRALSAKELSVSEAIDHHLSTLESFAHLNAVVAARDPEALSREVALAQEMIDRGTGSVLTGIPITVKDTVAVAGLPLSAGSRLLLEHRSNLDAGVVKRVREAGGLVLGKTNCPEFGFGIGCSNDLFGPTLNPIAENLSPGGSSGGEAASVAAGISLLGIGTDYGGSLRWPAQCTGILSIRPTPGRLPARGQLLGSGLSGTDGNSRFRDASLQAQLQVPGFLARSVADLESALFATATSSERVGKLPPGNFELRSIPIGWSDGANIGAISHEVQTMMADLAALLNQDKFAITYVPDAFGGARQAFDELRSYEDLADLRRLARGREEEPTAVVRALIDSPRPPMQSFDDATRKAREKRSEGLGQLDATPLFLLPVAGCAAVGFDEKATIDGVSYQGFELMAHCRAISLLAVPVVSIPAARTRSGLPLSVQVIAPPFQEHLALAMARRIESLGGGWQMAAHRGPIPP